ncbi:hypothetical protein SEA_DAISHI_52 [Mycobacterium phage Daishi]|uniref:Uncharacterized protein n=1 Tax=Mycobacterium phage Daishi TaxID=2510509 RepID=A0A411CUC7_BPMB2|nr:hypothetical protein SEA_DAISHI_52 [Mycobacterium phage Daishi]
MTMIDPFASAPADDEAQAAPAEAPEESLFNEPPAEAPKKAPAKAAPAKVTNVAAPSEGKVVLTFKGGTGFDAPWIVIHAESLQDAYEQMVGDNGALLGELFTRVQNAGQAFAKLAPQQAAGGGNGGSRGGGTQRQSNAPQAAQEAPNGEKRYCAHGEMKFRSGVSKKTGKPYQMFVCQSGDRNDECDAQFLNSRR